MSVDFRESVTKENLMRAFAGESQARNRYTIAAAQAHREKQHVIEAVFRFTADQERQHAAVFYEHLRELGGQSIHIDGSYPVDISDNLSQLLRFAEHNEYEEHDDVYQSFAKTAKEEGFSKIAGTFQMIADIEKVHGDRFGTFASLIANGLLYKSDCAPSADTEWLCLNCGHIHKGPSAPANCPVCHADRGFFVPFKYYDFKEKGYAN